MPWMSMTLSVKTANIALVQGAEAQVLPRANSSKTELRNLVDWWREEIRPEAKRPSRPRNPFIVSEVDYCGFVVLAAISQIGCLCLKLTSMRLKKTGHS